MAIRFYDEALSEKFQKWMPEESKIKILKPEETAAFFSIKLDENNDKPLSLPTIALSRDTSIEILNTNKQIITFDGVTIGKTKDKSLTLNAIPIQLNYQLDIYAQKMAEADEYLRNFLFNIINYPKLTINIPYYEQNLKHDSNIRLLSTVEDNSDIPQRRFRDQFIRYTIKFTIDDAYLFSTPIKTNKAILESDLTMKDSIAESKATDDEDGNEGSNNNETTESILVDIDN